MVSSSVLIKLLVLISCASAALAETHTVGGASGWTTGQNYGTWASSQTFVVGDTLVFNFATGTHTVTEVDKSGYDNCAASGNPITITSPATIDLTATGTHYFICTVGTYCNDGMMLVVNI